MNAINFLEICILKNKLKSLLQVKYLLLILFVLFTFASDFVDGNKVVLPSNEFAIVVFFYLLSFLGIFGVTYIAFTKPFNLKKADKKFLVVAPIKFSALCSLELRKKLYFWCCASIFALAYYILYFCAGNISGISKMIIFAVIILFLEINVFTALYRYSIHKNSVRIILKISSVIAWILLAFCLCSHIAQYKFIVSLLNKLSHFYNYSLILYVASVLCCLMSVFFNICSRKTLLNDRENYKIINEYFECETNVKLYEPTNITGIVKKTYVEMYRSKMFMTKQIVIALFGILLAILCVGVCETFGEFHGTSITCLFMLVYATISGFIFGIDIFEIEIKKHYLHLIPQNAVVKFVKIAMPYMINQFAIGVILICIVSCFNLWNINELTLILEYFSFLIITLSSELVFFRVYKNENTSDGLAIVFNGIIKIVLYTPSFMIVVASFLFPINQLTYATSLIITNGLIALMATKLSHKVL